MLGSSFSFFKNTNSYFYQIFAPYLPYPDQKHHEFVLVDTSVADFDKIIEIVDEIDSYRPSFIIMDISHQRDESGAVSRDNLEYLIEKYPEVVVALPYFKDLNFCNDIEPIKRYDFRGLFDDGFDYSTLKGDHIVTIFSTENYRELYGDARVNYNGNPKFSEIHLNDFLEGNIVPDLFKDKIVVISNLDNHYVPAFNLISIDEYFIHQVHLAMILKSELGGSWLIGFELWSYYLFIIFITVAWIYFLYLFPLYYKYYLFIFSLIVPLALYLLLLIYINFLLPISEMITVAVVVTILLFRHWQSLQNESESSMLNSLTKRLQEKVVHQTFYNSDSYWYDIILLVNQLFDLKKNILFEKIDKEVYIKEVASFNCEFSNINEMRRDSRREPYSSALKYKKLIKIDRKFFQDIDDGDEEYIVPLIHRSTLIGFWVFSLKSLEANSIKNFESLINISAKEISELLFNRSQFIRLKESKSLDIEKILNVEIEDRNKYRLKQSLSVIEKRMLLTETTLDTLHSAIIVYNLFGKVIQINQPMSDLLQQEKITIYTLSVSEMISTLTQLTPSESKELILNVILTQKSYTYFVNFKTDSKRYLLTISAITQEKIAHKFAADYIFDTFGVLLEFYNLAFIENIFHLKQDVIEYSLKQNSARVQSLKTVADSNQNDTIDKTIFYSNYLQALMREDIDNSSDSLYPVDIMRIVNISSQEVSSRYPQKQIKFDIIAHTLLPLVMVSANSIQRDIQNILTILVEDIEESGDLYIELEAKEHDLHLALKSNGYGMPSTQLNNYLTTEMAPQKYLLVQKSIDNINSWMGSIIFHSKLGSGIEIELSLKTANL